MFLLSVKGKNNNEGSGSLYKTIESSWSRKLMEYSVPLALWLSSFRRKGDAACALLLLSLPSSTSESLRSKHGFRSTRMEVGGKVVVMMVLGSAGLFGAGFGFPFSDCKI